MSKGSYTITITIIVLLSAIIISTETISSEIKEAESNIDISQEVIEKAKSENSKKETQDKADEPPLIIDRDGDGVEDYLETNFYGTTFYDPDTDDDQMPDGLEIDNGLNPFEDDAYNDEDGDNLSNIREYAEGTDVHNPDTDGDGIDDGKEYFCYTTSPLIFDADRDNDGIPDKVDRDPNNAVTGEIQISMQISPDDDIITTTSDVKVTATVNTTGDLRVFTLMINGIQLKEAEEGTYTRTIKNLSDSVHEILVVASTLQGKDCVEMTQVTINAKGPEVEIRGMLASEKIHTQNIYMTVKVEDADIESTKFYVNDIEVPEFRYIQKYNDISTWVRLTNVEGPNAENTIRVEATDAYGRTGSDSNTVIFDWIHSRSCEDCPNKESGCPYFEDGDCDEDGVLNSSDLFPRDPRESSDKDSDGVGDYHDPDSNDPWTSGEINTLYPPKYHEIDARIDHIKTTKFVIVGRVRSAATKQAKNAEKFDESYKKRVAEAIEGADKIIVHLYGDYDSKVTYKGEEVKEIIEAIKNSDSAEGVNEAWLEFYRVVFYQGEGKIAEMVTKPPVFHLFGRQYIDNSGTLEKLVRTN